MIIAIDFDGTVCESNFPQIVGMIKGARESINRLYAAGHYIIVWTCRSGDNLRDCVNWLLEQGIKFHRINDNKPEQTALYSNNSRKVYAHCYIDDKNCGGFAGWEWAEKWVEESEREYQLKVSN